MGTSSSVGYAEDSETQSTNSFFQVVVLYFLLVLALRFYGHTAEFANGHSNSVYEFRGSSCAKLVHHYKDNLFPIFSILELDCFPKTQRQRLRKNYNDQFGRKSFLTSSVEVT